MSFNPYQPHSCFLAVLHELSQVEYGLCDLRDVVSGESLFETSDQVLLPHCPQLHPAGDKGWEGRREGWRYGGRKEGREGGRDGGREGGREGGLQGLHEKGREVGFGK